MAKILTEEVLKALKKFDLPKGYQRTGEFPLDPSSIFFSKADADLYAAGGADSRGLSGTRYAGQLIAVVEGGVTTLYTVEANDKLKAVGGDVSADLADLTSKVNAILKDATSIDSFKDVEDALANLPKDMVVSGGEVRVATEDEVAKYSLESDKKYIVLTIANATEGNKDKLFILVEDLVDVYSGSDYIDVSDKNAISLKLSDLETQLHKDDFVKTDDITDFVSKEDLNKVSKTADAASSKADANEGRIGTLENVVGKAAEGEQVATGLVGDIAYVKSSITAINDSLKGYEVKNVDSTVSNGVNLTLSNDGKVGVNVIPEDVVGAVYDTIKNKLNSDGVNSDTSKVKLSDNIGSTGEEQDPYRYKKDADLQSVLKNIDERIKSNSESISAAVAGGVASITPGDGISVDTKNSNSTTQPKVSVNVDSDSNLSFTSDGKLTLSWIEIE